MIIAIHAIAGALIGEWINNSLFAFILVIISHFLIDMISHSDLPVYKKGNDIKNCNYIESGFIFSRQTECGNYYC